MFKYIKNKNNGNIILIYHSSFDQKDSERDKFIHNVTPNNIITQITFLKDYYTIVPIDDIFSKDSTASLCNLETHLPKKITFTEKKSQRILSTVTVIIPFI